MGAGGELLLAPDGLELPVAGPVSTGCRVFFQELRMTALETAVVGSLALCLLAALAATRFRGW